jgi:hypothetical protein
MSAKNGDHMKNAIRRSDCRDNDPDRQSAR